MWFSAAKAYLAMVARRKRVTLARDGVRMAVGLQRGQGLWCGISGLDFEPELSWLVNRLPEGGVFMDVGANVGAYSLHCARRVGEDGKVIAFEPGYEAMTMFQESIRLNGYQKRIQAISAAVADRDGVMHLEGSSGSWFNMHLSTESVGKPVSVRSIDSVCQELNLNRVDAIKVDAEGFERQVFEGSLGVLQKFRPVVVFEHIRDGRESVLGFLKDSGYRIFLLNPDRRTLSSFTEDVSVSNLIGIPHESI